MTIIFERPPNFELILKAFPDADKPGVLFAWGDDIYHPTPTGHIQPALLAHEAVHGKRQLGMSGSGIRTGKIELWWEKYLVDAEFRYTEELLAHVAEFRAQTSRATDRNIRAKILQSTAARLVAPLYNYQPPRTLAQALRDLRWEMEQ